MLDLWGSGFCSIPILLFQHVDELVNGEGSKGCSLLPPIFFRKKLVSSRYDHRQGDKYSTDCRRQSRKFSCSFIFHFRS
jgi:hypothetical protein